MRHIFQTGIMIVCGAALLGTASVAQHRDDSIEESWERAAREKEDQGRQEQQYQWKQQEERQAQPPAEDRTAQWPYLPPNPAAQDFYNANAALIDSLDNMYCVSSSYLRTLRNRNESALAAAPPAPPPPAKEKAQNDGKFGYEKESWDRGEKKDEPAPPPVPSRAAQELETLNQELFQLLDKCLNN